uniref:Mg transporter n=1 Tax=Mycena chlorophos TaxID=658473 RepID=A0ABQ0M0Y1_MYCCL|nr:Mg transporter [Mycena chlorophos]
MNSPEHLKLNPIQPSPTQATFRLQNGSKHVEYEPSVDDDEEDEDDEDLVMEDVSRALLTPATPRFSQMNAKPPGVWSHVKAIVVESAPTLLFSTMGLLFTGELLDHVSRWKALQQVDQLIIVIPVILNLKGNLEMNLSARLGTAANVGELDEKKARRAIILGNLTLLQVQATAVSFVASAVSLLLGLVLPRSPTEVAARAVRPLPPPAPADTPRRSGFPTFLYVASSAMAAACASSLMLGSFMCALVVVCLRFGLDPDNIAPPIASCLGDLVTLVLLSLIASVLFPTLHTPIPSVILILLILFAVSCGLYTRRNRLVAPLLTQGWSPLLAAMIISSGTGIVLDLFVSRYSGFALLAIVISGLPGGVGSIFASRLSTSLHAAKLGADGDHAPKPKSPSDWVVMLTLLAVTIPVEILFLTLLTVFGWLDLPFVFAAFSVLFFCIAVAASLLLARWLVQFLWARNLDPDVVWLRTESDAKLALGKPKINKAGDEVVIPVEVAKKTLYAVDWCKVEDLTPVNARCDIHRPEKEGPAVPIGSEVMSADDATTQRRSSSGRLERSHCDKVAWLSTAHSGGTIMLHIHRLEAPPKEAATKRKNSTIDDFEMVLDNEDSDDAFMPHDAETDTETNKDAEDTATLSEPDKRALQNIMDELVTDDRSWLFREPVDPVALQIPEYYSIIKNPRDLRSIRTNLDDNAYPSVEAFEADLKLMTDNAILFNGTTTQVGEIVVKFQEFCERVMREYWQEKIQSEQGRGEPMRPFVAFVFVFKRVKEKGREKETKAVSEPVPSSGATGAGARQTALKSPIQNSAGLTPPSRTEEDAPSSAEPGSEVAPAPQTPQRPRLDVDSASIPAKRTAQEVLEDVEKLLDRKKRAKTKREQIEQENDRRREEIAQLTIQARQEAEAAEASLIEAERQSRELETKLDEIKARMKR